MWNITSRIKEATLITMNTESIYTSLINGNYTQASEYLNELLKEYHGELEQRQLFDKYDMVDIQKAQELIVNE